LTVAATFRWYDVLSLGRIMVTCSEFPPPPFFVELLRGSVLLIRLIQFQ